MTTTPKPRGRPAIGAPRQIRMPDDLWELAAAFGDGNVNAGVRIAVEAEAKRRERKAQALSGSILRQRAKAAP